MMQKRFSVPIYNFNVYVTDKEHTMQLEELMNEGRGLGGVVYWYHGKLCIYVATDSGKRNDEFLAHECVHCAYEILKTVGVKVEADNHEALAYLVSYIYRNVSRILREKVKYEKGSRL